MGAIWKFNYFLYDNLDNLIFKNSVKYVYVKKNTIVVQNSQWLCRMSTNLNFNKYIYRNFLTV